MTTSVYADYAASTPTDPRVALRVQKILTNYIGNPSSAHSFGQAAAAELKQARQTVANFIGANLEEIFFTATGTESNNLAIIGTAKANKAKGMHIITTEIEHPSILNACKALEKDGWQITYLPVNQNGQISLENLEKAIKQETVLFSTHYGNSELGTLPDIKAIAALCKKHDILLHLDACQAMAFEKMNAQDMDFDLLTFNGSKIYGPKGVGVLFIRNGVSIFPILYGGGQEQSLRSGTENLAGIVGLAEAIKVIENQRDEDKKKISTLRDYLQSELEKLGQVKINAKEASRLPNHLSVTFLDIENKDLVKLLDQQSIAVSAGSACSSTSIIESHVLTSIGLSPKQAQATLRITLGRQTTEQDCQAIIKAIKTVIN